ncbi:MAG: tetratricopeptide repeat protein [Vulcanimicrobiaceae bacterium]
MTLVRELRDIEAALTRDPNAIALLLRRAVLLDALGRTDLARDAYINVIQLDPAHLEALTSLGTLLFGSGYRSAARLAYEEALRRHGDMAPVLVNLANTLLELGAVSDARARYERALALDPDCAAAHQGLSYALDRSGEHERALYHRRAGFGAQPIRIERYRGAGTPIAVIVLLCASGGNIAIDLFLDDTTFLVIKIFADFYDRAQPLPQHDAIFNAIGDAEMCTGALLAASELLRATDAPVINAPARVLATSRVDISARCAHIAGVVAPRTRLLLREQFDAECTLPVLVRSPGFHTGEHFERIDSSEDMAATLAALPGAALLAIDWLDARGSDGCTRKYRVMVIDTELYPVHLAVSSHWKVHYFTADLMHEAAYRREEERFLGDMAGVLGERAIAALREIAGTLQLDYAGIDFGIDLRGRVLLFEANATMKIVPPDADPQHAYRRAPIERALAAARALVVRRSVASATGRLHGDPLAGA